MPYYSDKRLKPCLRKFRNIYVKTRSLDLRANMMLMKLSFIETPAVLYNSFAVYDFSCPGYSPITLAKQE